ncbi:MAG TPA: hypothetical protein VF989_04585 [Polyangiaceae bacterium]|jgi:hypothetical protein
MSIEITRKQFLLSNAVVYGAAAGFIVASCGGDDSDDGDTGSASGDTGTTGATSTGAGGSAGSGGTDPNGGAGGMMDSGPSVDSCEADVGTVNMHTHAVTVPAEDVEAGTETTYALSSVLGHDHEITLDADDFAALAAGDSITVNSTSEEGHTHPVTITCE